MNETVEMTTPHKWQEKSLLWIAELEFAHVR